MSAFLHELLVLKRGIIIVFSWAMISCPIIVNTGPTKSKHHKPYEYRDLFYKLQNVVLLQLNSNKSTPTTCLVVLSPTPFPHHRHVFLRTGNLLQYDKPCCVIEKITTRWYLQKKNRSDFFGSYCTSFKWETKNSKNGSDDWRSGKICPLTPTTEPTDPNGVILLGLFSPTSAHKTRVLTG